MSKFVIPGYIKSQIRYIYFETKKIEWIVYMSRLILLISILRQMEYYEMFYPIIWYQYITWRLLSLSPTRAEPLAPYSRTHAAAQRERKEREAKTTPTGGFLSAATSILPVSASPLLPPLVSAHPEETTRPWSPEESFGHGGGGGGSEGMPGRASGGALLGLRRWGGCGGGVGGAAAAAATAAEASAAAAAAGAQPPQAAQQGAPRQHRGSGPSPPLLSSPTNMARIQCTPPRSPSISRFVFSFLFLLWSLAGMEGRKEWIHGGEKKRKGGGAFGMEVAKKVLLFWLMGRLARAWWWARFGSVDWLFLLLSWTMHWGFFRWWRKRLAFGGTFYGCPCFFGFSPLQGRKDMVAFLSLEENRLQSVFFLFFLSFFSSEPLTNFAFVAQRFLLWSMVDSLLHGCFGLSEVALVWYMEF